MRSAISLTGTFGLNVVGPDRIISSAVAWGSASSYFRRSSPNTIRSSLTTTQASQSGRKRERDLTRLVAAHSPFG
jgi:hypothetical protein